jgi:hypothetical protein
MLNFLLSAHLTHENYHHCFCVFPRLIEEGFFMKIQITPGGPMFDYSKLHKSGNIHSIILEAGRQLCLWLSAALQKQKTKQNKTT